MSRFWDLVSRSCPNGAPYRPLADFIAYEQPGKYLVTSTEYNDNYSTPVLTAGQTFVLGYTNESDGVYAASPDHPVVIFDDFTTAFKWVSFPFKAKSSAMKMLTVSDETLVDLRYVYYAMQTIRYVPKDHARQWIGKYSRFRIPLPPLEVQREIVRILDHFTELEADLERELEARRLQYDHYRSIILGWASQAGDSLELGQLGQIVTGRTPKASDSGAWGTEIDFVTPSDIKNGMRTVSETSRRLSAAGAATMSRVRVPAGSLLVTCIGADMGKTVINADECVPNQQINAIVLSPGIHSGYLFHVLTSMRGSLRAQGERGGSTLPLINKTDFSKIAVPVPSFEVQEAAATRLDKFDALLNDPAIGLPAELRGRRRQYEYYRDKLLRFPEAAA